MGCRFLLRGIFLTQGSNPRLLESPTLQADSLPLSHQGSPYPSKLSQAKSLQSCPILCDPIDGSPPGSPVPGILQAKNPTRVGCHFRLQCMEVKSESEVAQSSPTLSDPMDCSLPGSSVHGIFQARVLEWGAIAFSQQHNTRRPNSTSH